MRVDAGLLQIVRDGAIDWPERGRVLLVGPASERPGQHGGEVVCLRHYTWLIGWVVIGAMSQGSHSIPMLVLMASKARL